MDRSIRPTRPDALLVVAAEHFANFFMNNMPAFAIGMAEHYDGPATPNSGKINEAWDRDFLAHWSANDQAALTAYTDEETYHQGGQGGFEIRTFIAVAGAAEGSVGKMLFYRPIPIFAVGCTVAVMQLAGGASSRSWRAGLSARVAMPPPCSGSECCWLGCNACSPA